MTLTGFYSFALGAALLWAPMHSCFKKFGSVTDETFARWFVELPLLEWFRVKFIIWSGLMLISWGLLQ